MAVARQTPGRPADRQASRASPAGSAVAVLMVSVVAAAAGWGFGLPRAVVEDARRKDDAAEVQPAKAAAGLAGSAAIRTLPPIVTGLAGPERAWVRIEASIVLDDGQEGDDALLTALISQDIVAFLQTVSMAEVEGARGFQHLREDLGERARVRSGGRVRDLVIHTFVVE
ncbi:MAG: flagellar basal body-associated FliL family protein [Hyphomicrobiaceae bacterium]|nr:flagellar basal body-associated FliL family protein [Hyphomicrobiaceae bacterium]